MVMINKEWQHVKTLVDGEPYNIWGRNIWSYPWQRTEEKVTVKDPHYGQTHTMDVYQIIENDLIIEFAAGEFSKCVWGIYRKE
jgi:hypothetical protein